MITRATAPYTSGRRSTVLDHRAQKPSPDERRSPAASARRCRRERTRGPMNPSIAGRNVSAAIIVKSTPMLAATASP